MSRLDLPAKVQDISRGTNHDLREMAGRLVDLAETHGDVETVVADSGTDPTHLVRVAWETVLAVGLEEWE